MKHWTAVAVEVEGNLQILLRKELKPWGEFFGGMSVTHKWDKKSAQFRFCSNLLFYRSNYFVIFCGILLLGLILNPIIVISLAIVIAWYIYVMLVLKGPFMIGDFKMDWKMRLVFCTITAVVFFTLTGALESLVLCSLFSSALCVVHMLMKEPQAGTKVTPAHHDFALAIFTALGVNESEFILNMSGGEDPSSLAESGRTSSSGDNEDSASFARRKSGTGGTHSP